MILATSFIPGLECALMIWHKSGGPSSRKVPTDYMLAYTHIWIRALQYVVIPKASVRAAMDSPSSDSKNSGMSLSVSAIFVVVLRC